ncbi:MAG: transglycosylase SLT domain-containing protein [Anaerolineales bacterium]|nr:transglycosylase SLT domain-containing protein [Anaerolineales bacterium]
MLFLLGLVGVVIALLLLLRPQANVEAAPETAAAASAAPAATDTEMGGGGPETAVAGAPIPAAPAGLLSPLFTPEVRHWEPQIVAWAAEFDLDPNLVATIMQIESCGDPTALSHAGASGLFQVMPFHFAAGEDPFDPDTNARRGLAYYVERLQQTEGDVGRAFAGYNGGQRAAAGSWDTWAAETRRYYVWTTGLYADVQAGLAVSPTLLDWIQSGAGTYCQVAARKLGL